MKKFIFKIIFLLIIIGFFISCGEQVSKIATLVPEEAVFFIMAENPDALFLEIDAFFESSSINLFTGSREVKLLFGDVISSSGMNLEWVDTTKPFGIAVLISSGFPGEPEPIILMPLANADSDIEAIESFASPKGIIVKRVENYAILASSTDITEMYPLSAYLDLSSLSKYEDNSVTAYINMKSIMTKYGPMITGGLGMAKSMLGPEMTGMDTNPANAALFSQIIDFYFVLIEKIIDVAKNINDISYSTAVNAKGVQLKSSSSVMEDSYVADFVNKAGADGDIKGYAKYLPDDYMFTVLGNMNPEAAKMVGMGMLDALAELSFIDSADMDELNQMVNNIYDSLGSKTAAAVDFKFNMGLLAGLTDMTSVEEDPASMTALFDDAISFDMIAVYELRDADLFRNTYKDAINGGLITKIINGFYEDIGMKFSLTYRENVAENGFEYDILSYDIYFSQFFESMGDDSPEAKIQMQMAGMFMDVLMEKFNFYLHYKDNQCFMAMGADGLELLKSLVENDSYTGGNMSESAVFTDILANVPADSNYFFQFSVTGFMDMLVSTISGGQMNSLNITDTTGLIGYGKFADNAMEGAIEYSSEEIAGLISNAGALMSLGM